MNTHTALRRWTSRAATAAVAVVLGLALVTQDSEARRFGGGKSFGRQSPNITRQQTPPPSKDPAAQSAPQQQNQAAAQPSQTPPAQPAAQPPRNRWLGPLTGLAAGLGIAALLSHFGLAGPLAEMLGSVLMIALLVFAAMFIWRMLRRNRNPAPIERRMQPAYGAAGAGLVRPDSVAALDQQPDTESSVPTSSPAETRSVPPDFDVPGFIRSAKVHFYRLQAAWREKNLADIREFTTPEVFAEIKMQIEENKGAADRTEVVTLDIELLGVETTATDYLASVRFTGTTRDGDGSAEEPFTEVWNIAKPKSDRSGWVLAGIQQMS